MSGRRENYCLLIGLNPFREGAYGPEDISMRIDRMENEWKNTRGNPKNSPKDKFYADSCLGIIDDIRATMTSPVLRPSEFDAARKLLQSKASHLKKDTVVLRNGRSVLFDNAAKTLSRNLRWKEVDAKTIIDASGIMPVLVPEPAAPEVMDAYEKMHDSGFGSPVDLINSIIGIRELRLEVKKLDANSTYDDIRAAFSSAEKRLNSMSAGKIPNQDHYIGILRTVKLALTPDGRLSSLIGYGKCMDALEPAFRMLDEDSGQPFTKEYLDGIIGCYVTQKGLDPEMSLMALESYCCRKRYPANFSEKLSSLTFCPSCAAMINSGPGVLFCPVCGTSIRVVCPVCGKGQAASNKTCTECGKELAESISDAAGMEGTVNALLSAGDTEGADDELRSLKKKYPSCGRLSELEERVNRSGDELVSVRAKVVADLASKNYYTLKCDVENGTGAFPDLLTDPDISARYREACGKVAEADALCIQASGKGRADAADLYIRALEICPDIPDAIGKLRDRPPVGPADASAEVRGSDVVISYAVPEDRRGMSFCVYRKAGSPPDVDKSTVPLGETRNGIYVDPTAEPGPSYYYRIYSKRWSILSHDFAECGPVTVIREVTNVSVETLEDGLCIRYEAPAGCSRVRIWRKEGSRPAGEGEETEIPGTEDGTVEDRGLKGGQTYNYLFVAEYDSGGRTERSLGTVFSGTTARYPEPVSDMTIRWNRADGTYVARWGTGRNVMLYASPRKIADFGCTMSLKDADRWMERIEPLESSAGEYRFAVPDGATAYIFPMTVVGETAVRGKEWLIANLRPFRDMEKKMNGSDCEISVTWPDGATAMVAETADIGDDTHSESISLSREAYEKEGRIRISLGSSCRRKVTLYAVYVIEGEEMRSVGITAELYSGESSLIHYTVSKRPDKNDKGKMFVSVSMDCAGAPSIPKCIMVRTAEGIPLKAKDGNIVWEADGPIVLINGHATIEFPAAKEDAETEHMRLFFPRREDYGPFRFVHPIYGGRD